MPAKDKSKPILQTALDWLEARGLDGCTPGEFKQKVWDLGKDHANLKCPSGYWGTALYSGSPCAGTAPIVPVFIQYHGKRFIRTAVPHNGRPWQVLRMKWPFVQYVPGLGRVLLPDEKSLEWYESNRRRLNAEFERGYAAGFNGGVSHVARQEHARISEYRKKETE